MKSNAFWNMTLCISLVSLQSTRRHVSVCSVQKTNLWLVLMDSIIDIISRYSEEAKSVSLPARESGRLTVVRFILPAL